MQRQSVYYVSLREVGCTIRKTVVISKNTSMRTGPPRLMLKRKSVCLPQRLVDLETLRHTKTLFTEFNFTIDLLRTGANAYIRSQGEVHKENPELRFLSMAKAEELSGISQQKVTTLFPFLCPRMPLGLRRNATGKAFGRTLATAAKCASSLN
jgi:hypothetical protein